MKKKAIDFIRVAHLRGPNIWTYRPVLEAWVDIGDLENYPSNLIPGFYERLTSLLPSLIEHRCGIGKRGGFLERVREGTWAAHILEHVALELQNLAGMQTGFGKARQTATRGVYKVAIRTRDEQVGRVALEEGRALIMAVIENQFYDIAGTVGRMRDLVDSVCLGPSTACIVDAAGERRIPFIRLTDGNLVQLGYGSRQRRIWTAETDQTSAIAESISSDKDLTKSLLQSCGVPVPEGRIVTSAADAWEAAEDIGTPVVVKPTDGNHGRGVSIELSTREEVETAYHLALAEGSEVLVERFVKGNEHRLLVVGGKIAAAARGDVAWVVGDGVSSMRALIDAQINADPRRGQTEDFPLNTIEVDNDPAVVFDLERQGFGKDSVPPAGKSVLIQRNGNVAVDVTDEVHPDVAAVVSLAARVVGLDIAGIDLVAEDISRPLAEQRGAIVEVNAGPGLLMHLKPAGGQPRPVGRAVIDHLFPADHDGRISIVGVAGNRGSSLIARLVAWLIRLDGRHVGLACRDGLYLDRRQVESTDCANWNSGQRLLMNRVVEAAVMENGAEMILSQGLAYDRCEVGIVTDVSSPELYAEYHIQDTDQLFNVLRTQVDVILPEGVAVLNAGDPLVADMAPLCDGEVMFFGLDEHLAPLVAHRGQGGRALFFRQSWLILANGATEIELIDITGVKLFTSAAPASRKEKVLAAVGAAWALGIEPDLIRAGLAKFDAEEAAAAKSASRSLKATTN